MVGQHVDVGTVRNGENMWWDFITTLTTVHLSTTVRVDREPLVRVDSDAEKSRVGLRGGKEVKSEISMILIIKAQLLT